MDVSPTQQLVSTIVVVALFVPIFWQIRRKVRDGRVQPLARRTNHHSRTYIVVLAVLNAVICVLFVAGAGVLFVQGQWAVATSLLLLAALDGTFVWLLLRQGSDLRREGLPDRAPSIMQRSMSRPRRVVAYTLGAVSGLVLVYVINQAVDSQWSAAAGGAVVAVALYGVSWWLYRPVRLAEKSEARRTTAN